jgi:hypothetical protein
MQKRGYLLLTALVAGLGSITTTSLVFAGSNSSIGARSTPAPAASSMTPPGSAALTPTAAPPSMPSTGPVRVKTKGFFAWAMLDRHTGDISGSRNLAATTSTESMIKIWIVADFLRRSAKEGGEPGKRRLTQGTAAIRDSDDDAAQSLYVAGGRDAVVRRMINKCGLTDTDVAGPRGIGDKGWWSYTRISARDAVRLGECVKNGTAAGPRWTAWVLQQMTRVRGTTAAEDQHSRRGGGRWGIIDGLPPALPAAEVSIKNGWTMINADQMWHLNCLAVTDDWVLAVLTRYPGKLGLKYGANVCKTVAEQLFSSKPSPSGS